MLFSMILEGLGPHLHGLTIESLLTIEDFLEEDWRFIKVDAWCTWLDFGSFFSCDLREGSVKYSLENVWKHTEQHRIRLSIASCCKITIFMCNLCRCDMKSLLPQYKYCKVIFAQFDENHNLLHWYKGWDWRQLKCFFLLFAQFCLQNILK